MKKTIVSALIALASISSFAANATQKWTDSYQQGTLEFYVENQQGIYLAFDCKDNDTKWPDQSFTIASRNERGVSSNDQAGPTLIIQMGKETYQMTDPSSAAGASNWQAFFDDVKKTKEKTLKVYAEGAPNNFRVFTTADLASLANKYKGTGCFFLN